MAVTIAHLSDLHFGPDFDLSLWQGVRRDLIDAKPTLLVVSGDLVDTPSPRHLLAARIELDDLAARAGATLIVVPGNHDVYGGGLQQPQLPDPDQWETKWYWRIPARISLTYARKRRDMGTTQWLGRRQPWFDRVFRCGPVDAARKAVPGGYPTEGFSKDVLDLPQEVPPIERSGRAWFDLLPTQLADDQAALVADIGSIPIQVARIDSNAEDSVAGLATGKVATADLLRLQTELKQQPGLALVRIAVIHHHVLPVAFTGAAAEIPRDASDYSGAEAGMVLENAGTALSILRDLRFDLILHGHHHRAQFARLDLEPADATGYAMAVVSAGSAAHKTRHDPRGNSFNWITIQNNGRIDVARQYYGDAKIANTHAGPRIKQDVFQETIAATKRRAFIRARERHGLECDRIERTFAITAHGDLVMDHVVTGLRLLQPDDAYQTRTHPIAPPHWGDVVRDSYKLTGETPGYQLTVSDDGKECVVTLPKLPDPARGWSYTMAHGCANSINMTRWEAWERENHARQQGASPRADWDQEWVGLRITHPVKELVIKLQLPASLSGIKPFVECRRGAPYPPRMINKERDADLPKPSEMKEHDPDLAAERLDFSPGAEHLNWTLRIEDPMVGHLYQLRWALPPDAQENHGGIIGEVDQWRSRLLACASSNPSSPRLMAAREVFDTMRDVLAGLLRERTADGSYAADEDWAVELFAYDRAGLSLRPVFIHWSWGGTMPSDFRIDLGDGIAGAAFLQSRAIPWSASKRAMPAYINPVPHTQVNGQAGMIARTVLALPIWHHKTTLVENVAQGWSMLGVVCFSSSSTASKVTAMCDRDPDRESEHCKQQVWNTAREQVHRLLGALSRGGG